MDADSHPSDRPPGLVALIKRIGQKSLSAGDFISYYVPCTTIAPQWLRRAQVLRVVPRDRYPIHLDTHDKIDPIINVIRWDADSSGLVNSTTQSGWRSIQTFDLVASEIAGPTRSDVLSDAMRNVVDEAISATIACIRSSQDSHRDREAESGEDKIGEDSSEVGDSTCDTNSEADTNTKTDRSSGSQRDSACPNEELIHADRADVLEQDDTPSHQVDETLTNRAIQENGDIQTLAPPQAVRPSWTRIWRSDENTGGTSNISWEAYLNTLPTHCRRHSQKSKCSLDHLARDEDVLHVKDHFVRRVVTICTSRQCNAGCSCRYKVHACEETNFAEVFITREHNHDSSHDSAPASPKLTAEMKTYLRSMLEENASVVPNKLFGLLSKKIAGGAFSKPAPRLKQVAGFVKRWKKNNRSDSMRPVIDICSQNMHRSGVPISRDPDKLIVLCDAVCSGGEMQPHLGNGSATSPFRIALTCFSLLSAYVKVQGLQDCNTILHLDSTHNMVDKHYPVFVIGFSDRRGSYFPIMYCCTSQRKEDDIAWLLRELKEVMRDAFDCVFKPEFVMTDCDDAHYNAIRAELPDTNILMCWFHVLQNVKNHTRGLQPRLIGMLFTDSNAMHFARTRVEYIKLRDHALAKWTTEGRTNTPFRKISLRLKKQWITNSRFSNWQAYLTKPGAAATNNPVETYHRTLKLVNDSSKATPTELVNRLDTSRLAFINDRAPFHTTPAASYRLRALYNGYVKRGELRAEIQPPSGDTRTALVFHKAEAIENLKAESDEKDDEIKNPDDVNKPIKSPHIRRMQWFGMPRCGWTVDIGNKACGCRYFFKYGICVHVIHATVTAGVPCPGMPDLEPRFVLASSRRTKAKEKKKRKPQRHTNSNPQTQDTPAVLEPIADASPPGGRRYNERSYNVTGCVAYEADLSFSPDYEDEEPFEQCRNTVVDAEIGGLSDWRDSGSADNDTNPHAPLVPQPLSYVALLNTSCSRPAAHPSGADTASHSPSTVPRASCAQTKRRRY